MVTPMGRGARGRLAVGHWMVVLVLVLFGIIQPSLAVAEIQLVSATMPATVPTTTPATMPTTMPAAAPLPLPWDTMRASGYVGQWYSPLRGPLMRMRFSGGMTFYPMTSEPVAIYSSAAEKTFFVYAGTGVHAEADVHAETHIQAGSAASRPHANASQPSTSISQPSTNVSQPHTSPSQADPQPLQVMVSYYDHKSGEVPRPVMLLEGPSGAYGCPALAIDDVGRLYVFSAMLGTGDQPGQIFRSIRPYDISAWEKIAELDFRNPQAWFIPGQGFMLLHTRIADEESRSTDEESNICLSTSRDGFTWSKPMPLATFGRVDSCVSAVFYDQVAHDKLANDKQDKVDDDKLDRDKAAHSKLGVAKVGVALVSRPGGNSPSGTNNASNTNNTTCLYYIETSDFGKTWRTYPSGHVSVPLDRPDNAAKVHDYGKDWWVGLRSLGFVAANGSPVILQVVRLHSKAMPAKDSRLWTFSRWMGREWQTAAQGYSDHDFDGGDFSLDQSPWHWVATTSPGPQPDAAGGNMIRWTSYDRGRSWSWQPLTHGSTVNQNWPRHPVNAADGMEFLWTDGDANKPSLSQIYFADRAGNVYQLPTSMASDSAKPKLLWKAPPPTSAPKPVQIINPESPESKPATMPAIMPAK